MTVEFVRPFSKNGVVQYLTQLLSGETVIQYFTELGLAIGNFSNFIQESFLFYFHNHFAA
jgi:hypothetical protein